MRYILCYILISFLPFLTHGQSRGELKFENTPLQEVFQQLESEYDVVFSYTSDVTDNVSVNVDIKNPTIDLVLDHLLDPLNLTYQIHENGYIVITEIDKKEVNLCATFINEEGESLSFVNVYLPEQAIGTSSNEEGVLEWKQRLRGNERVEISYIGYQDIVTDANALRSCPQITLKAKQFSFEEVIVKEYVVSGIEQSSDMDHMIMRPNKINMVPGLTDADVLQLVQLLPGVESIDESATGLHIRGGTPDQNLILYDGIPIYNSGHFFGMLSAFNPSLVDKVEVYRSGFGPNYGGRVAGVIDIKSIDNIPDRVKADAGVNFTHGDISLALPVVKDKVGLVLGVRKSYTDIIETPTYRKLSERVFRKGKLDELNDDDPEVLDFTLAFDFNDFNGKLLFEPTKKDKISWSYFRIDDNLNFDFRDFDDDFSTNDKIDQSSTGWGARWERFWNAHFSSTINYSRTELINSYEFKLHDGDSTELELEDAQINDINDNTVVWDNHWKLSNFFNLDFGGQYSDLNVQRSWLSEESDMEEDREIDANKILTGYFSFNSQLAKKIITKVGLRWNYSNATSESYLEPRLNFQYLPFQSFQIRASAGYYYQFMSQVIEFNDLGINQDFWVLYDDEESNPVTLSKNLTLGMLFYPKSFMLEVEGYYKQISGLTSNLSGFNINLEEDFEFGAGKSWGIDVLLKKRWNKFQSWISYSYSRTKYNIDLEDEILRFNAPHDRPHSLILMNQYQNNRWNISLSWRVASGINYTEVKELSDNDEEPEPLYELAEINANRLPISHRLDLSIIYSAFKKNGFSGKIGFSLLNIYNRENLMSREYFSIFDDEENIHKLQARDRAMLRFTPNIVFRLGFE